MIKIFISSCLVLLAFCANAQFQEGIEAYQNKQFKKARTFFLKSLEQEETAAIYYNIGLTYFEEKKFVAALSNFENALKIKPRFEDAMINAALTKDKIEADAIWAHPYSWLERFIYSIGSKYWITIIYTSSIMLGTTLFLLLMYRKRKVVLLFFLLSIFALPMSILALNKLEKHIHLKEYCFAKNKNTTLLLSPNGLEQPEKIELGKRYRIIKESQNHFQIKTEGNRLFWVSAESVFYY
ncbi:MAG: hypothetical protein ACPGU5_06020 [Lishizhenia sp.]